MKKREGEAKAVKERKRKRERERACKTMTYFYVAACSLLWHSKCSCIMKYNVYDACSGAQIARNTITAKPTMRECTSVCV